MKKKIWIFLFLISLLLLSASACAEQKAISTKKDQQITNNQTGFILPASLVSIEEDAFSGTAAVYVKMSDEVTSIGDQAFAHMPSLLLLRMSGTVQNLGEHLFEKDSKITVTGAINQKGALWAKEHNIPFIPEAGMSNTESNNEYCIVCYSDKYVADQYRINRAKGTVKSEQEMHRPGRTTGELKASHYKGKAAQHIQSRYFP